jgi:hypothetical protein
MSGLISTFVCGAQVATLVPPVNYLTTLEHYLHRSFWFLALAVCMHAFLDYITLTIEGIPVVDDKEIVPDTYDEFGWWIFMFSWGTFNAYSVVQSIGVYTGERSAVKMINGDDDKLNSIAAEQHGAKSTSNPFFDHLDGEINPDRVLSKKEAVATLEMDTTE